jgi:hypothetical protein
MHTFTMTIAICATLASSVGGLEPRAITPEQATGLQVLNIGGSDGQNEVVTRGGRQVWQVRRDAGSSFLYVQLEPPVAERLPDSLYVTVDYLDLSGRIYCQYDAGEAGSSYVQAPDGYAQEGSETWKTAVFTLWDPEFQRRQNGGADFRIGGNRDVVVSRISLVHTPPDGYRAPENPAAFFRSRPPVRFPEGMTIIQQWQVHQPVSAAVLRDQAYESCRQIGITSLQSYVGWAQIEPEPGSPDFSVYDPVVDQIRAHGLKWLPFLIASTYVATPEWFRETDGVDFRCLDHDTATPIQSIWNPALGAGVRRFLELFKSHYEPEAIEALNLGITGNWGESIYVAGGGFNFQGRHTHMGWWCGDDHARADFRRWVAVRYGTVERLNRAWGSENESLAEVEPFIPSEHPSPRARVDLTLWYSQAMTHYAEHWVRVTRELYPDLPIYLCTGGSGEAMLGADFSAQARMCARYGAGIRITNQSDDALMNFAITRLVSSACRLYGGYYTTEPGGAFTYRGMAGRVVDVVSGGAVGAYFKSLIERDMYPGATARALAPYAEEMKVNPPDLKVAALVPVTAMAIHGHGVLHQFLQRTAHLRDAFDFEFMDENMIRDRLLDRVRALMIVYGQELEQSALDEVRAWVERGGVLFLATDDLQSVEGEAATWVHDGDAVTGVGDVTILARGRGFVVHCSEDADEAAEQINHFVHLQADQAPWATQLSPAVDGRFDDIIAAVGPDRLLYANNTDEPLTMPGPGGDQVTIAPRGLVGFPRD